MTKNLQKIPPEMYSKYLDPQEIVVKNEGVQIESALGKINIHAYGIMIVMFLVLISGFILS